MDIQELCKQLFKLIDITLTDLPYFNQTHLEQILSIYKLQAILTELQEKHKGEKLSVENVKPLCDFLHRRWNRIINTDLSYPHNPTAPANIICLTLAEMLEEVCGISRYQLLMHTLKRIQNEVTTTDLKDVTVGIQEFVLSDDNQNIIEVFPCLDFASEDGILKHTCLFEGKPKRLSKAEADRVIKHSIHAMAVYKLIKEKIKEEQTGTSFGTVLKRLTKELRNGGKKAHEDGDELNAGHNANEGIYAFSEWLESLKDEDKARLLECSAPGLHKNFGDLWARLSRPTETNYKELIYCVEIIANEIDIILDHNQWLHDYIPEKPIGLKRNSLSHFDRSIQREKSLLQAAINNPEYRVCASYGLLGQERMGQVLDFLMSDNKQLKEVFDGLGKSNGHESTIKLQFAMIIQIAVYLKEKKVNELSPILQVELALHALGKALRSIITRHDTFLILLNSLPYCDAQPSVCRSVLLNYLAPKLLTLMTKISELHAVLNVLDETSKIELVELLGQDIQFIIKKSVHFDSFIQHFSDANRTKIIKFLYLNTSLFSSGSADIIAQFKWLSTSEQINLINFLESKLPQLVQNVDQLITLLHCQSLQKTKTILSTLKERLPHIVKNQEDYIKVVYSIKSAEDKEMLAKVLGYEKKCADSTANHRYVGIFRFFFPSAHTASPHDNNKSFTENQNDHGCRIS